MDSFWEKKRLCKIDIIFYSEKSGEGKRNNCLKYIENQLFSHVENSVDNVDNKL